MDGCKTASDSPPLTLDLNRDRYRELIAARGWTRQTDQADGIGVSQVTISRVVERPGRPGPRFIAALLTTFPDEDFEDLFNVVEDVPLTRAA